MPAARRLQRDHARLDRSERAARIHTLVPRRLEQPVDEAARIDRIERELPARRSGCGCSPPCARIRAIRPLRCAPPSPRSASPARRPTPASIVVVQMRVDAAHARARMRARRPPAAAPRFSSPKAEAVEAGSRASTLNARSCARHTSSVAVSCAVTTTSSGAKRREVTRVRDAVEEDRQRHASRANRARVVRVATGERVDALFGSDARHGARIEPVGVALAHRVDARRCRRAAGSAAGCGGSPRCRSRSTTRGRAARRALRRRHAAARRCGSDGEVSACRGLHGGRVDYRARVRIRDSLYYFRDSIRNSHHLVGARGAAAGAAVRTDACADALDEPAQPRGRRIAPIRRRTAESAGSPDATSAGAACRPRSPAR